MNTAMDLLHTGIDRLRQHLDEYRYTTAAVGRLLEDRDYYRVEHDLDAIRTRFERSPAWPASGAASERR